MGRVLWMVSVGALKTLSSVMAEENIIHAPADFIKIAQKLKKGIKGVFARKKCL